VNGPNGRGSAELLGGLTLEVVTQTGRAAAVELRLQSATVEIWHHRTLVAALDRDVFRKWLGDPATPFAGDQVTFSLDRMVDLHGRVAITLPDVLAWTLSPSEQHTLRRLL
jgi:hypothetical protein